MMSIRDTISVPFFLFFIVHPKSIFLFLLIVKWVPWWSFLTPCGDSFSMLCGRSISNLDPRAMYPAVFPWTLGPGKVDCHSQPRSPGFNIGNNCNLQQKKFCSVPTFYVLTYRTKHFDSVTSELSHYGWYVGIIKTSFLTPRNWYTLYTRQDGHGLYYSLYAQCIWSVVYRHRSYVCMV